MKLVKGGLVLTGWDADAFRRRKAEGGRRKAEGGRRKADDGERPIGMSAIDFYPNN